MTSQDSCSRATGAGAIGNRLEKHSVHEEASSECLEVEAMGCGSRVRGAGRLTSLTVRRSGSKQRRPAKPSNDLAEGREVGYGCLPNRLGAVARTAGQVIAIRTWSASGAVSREGRAPPRHERS
jgi:hypothetical protein